MCSKAEIKLYGLRAKEKEKQATVQLVKEITCYCGRMARIQKLQNLGIMESCPSLVNVLVKHICGNTFMHGSWGTVGGSVVWVVHNSPIKGVMPESAEEFHDSEL